MRRALRVSDRQKNGRGAHAALPLLALLCACALLAGCNIVKGFSYFFSPERVAKAEHKLETGKLAVVIDPARPDEVNPVFEQALVQKLQEIFSEKKSKIEFVPYAEIMALRQQHEDFGKWPIQRIGHELGADYVLYLRQDKLSSHSSPSHPLLEPSVLLRAKLIETDKPPEQARVWPPEKEGREVACSRQTQQATGIDLVDSEMAKLGKDTAWLVVIPFFDTSEEVKPPVEK